MSLRTRQLGHSDLAITPVGIGTAPIGSTPAWRINWGPQDEGQSIRTIQMALDLGVNWIDTAPFYGWGRAEQIVGKAVRGRRERVYLFTKCGTLPDGQGGWREDLSAASIRREVESSLRNLQTDYLDLYQFHDPDPSTPIEESWAALQALIQEGKVRYGGLSNHPVELMARALALAPVTSNQHQYNLLERAIERDVLPYSQTHGIGVLCWSPLASGFLTDDFDLERLAPDDFRRQHRYTREPDASKLVQVRQALGTIAHDRGRTLANLAISWVLRQPAVTGAIMGIRSEREAQEMVRAPDWELNAQEIAAVERALAPWSPDR
jgi:aryl-alcohol dehydrogenase-like predicted oxidoreductase